MDVIKRVAKEHGVSPDEVRREMELAIKAGMENPDPRVREKWKQLFGDEKEPTPEELIKVLAETIKNGK